MSPKTTKQKGGEISIGGNVNTGGGSIAGGNINIMKVNVNSKIENINTLFAPIYSAIEKQNNFTNKKKIQLTNKIQNLEAEAGKKAPDKNKVEGLLIDIAKMAPDILEVVITTLCNPLIGLATVAKKVSQKAKLQSGN